MPQLKHGLSVLPSLLLVCTGLLAAPVSADDAAMTEPDDAVILVGDPFTAVEPSPFDEKGSTEALCGNHSCTSSQTCVYCMGMHSCRPIGSSCCWPYICNPDQDCVYCMGAQRCYLKGSTCCYPYICNPTQRCEIGYGGSKRCVPR